MVKFTRMRMAVITLVIGSAHIVGAQNAMAQERPDTLRMSCAASADVVRRAGAIVLRSGPNIYDRYVIAQNFCSPDEIMKPAWTPAADNAQCFIGYVCQRESWGAGPR